MTIEEIKESKLKAEKEIINILYDLEKITDMKVRGVDYETTEEQGFGVVKIVTITKFGITLAI